MKRRILLLGSLAAGFLVIIILLAGPAAPLFVRLGVQPICLQGDLPRLRLVACPESMFGRPTPTSYALPTLAAQGPIPVIVDDDGSPDGVLALLFFLRHPGYDVKAVTVSTGEAHPQVFAQHVARLLAALGREDIPVGFGSANPLAGSNSFPEPWRQASDDFWGLPLPQARTPANPSPAARLIVDSLSAPTRPAMVFVSGTHTNLAEALRLDPGVADQIQAVHFMGGSINVPGNIESDWPAIPNRVAEWNIWVDPMAAREVIESGLPLHMVPLDATHKVVWTEEDARDWSSSAEPASRMAGEILTMMLRTWSVDEVYAWDLVAAAAATEARLCSETPLALNVIVEAGPEQGRTAVEDGPANIEACLDPDPAQIKATVAAMFAR